MEGSANESDQAILVAYLKDRDVACPECDYNLRDQTSNLCPECGRQIQLAIASNDSSLTAWIMLAFGVFTTAGCGLLFIIYFGVNGYYPPVGPEVSAALLYFMASPLLAGLAVRGRRGFLKLPAGVQMNIAIVSVVFSLLSIAVFGIRVK